MSNEVKASLEYTDSAETTSGVAIVNNTKVLLAIC
jgi:hypothetical protein